MIDRVLRRESKLKISRRYYLLIIVSLIFYIYIYIVISIKDKTPRMEKIARFDPRVSRPRNAIKKKRRLRPAIIFLDATLACQLFPVFFLYSARKRILYW